ncbi:c-type cytochrome [Thalassoroseus pseudoceratinae]|uniref:c-type cytochrome n=1 Tax=Thalassoroseus pseudoceratinae TaxID=2713176 RepID=UPI001423AF21|nr:c-type cytochrome [Thalassoroseus pseudoceratinae]
MSRSLLIVRGGGWCCLGFVLGAFSLGQVVAEDAKVLTQVPEVAASQVKGETAEPNDSPVVDFNQGPKPKWIWGEGNDNQTWYFRKTFSVDRGWTGTMIASCDNVMTVHLNGKKVFSSSEWQTPETREIGAMLKRGENEILVEANNAGGIAAFAMKLVLGSKRDPNADPKYIVTDDSWTASRQKSGSDAVAVRTIGKMGDQPWGNVFSKTGLASSQPRNVFQTPPGFQVELLYTVPKDELGSWVCITFDETGRLIASDQGDKGLCRITPPPIGSDEPTKVEPLDVKMTSAQGMLAAFGHLYCSVNGGPGSGFYRLTDTDGDDQYDEVKKLQSFQGGGEHGPHAVRLSPDGKSLFVIAGNHTNPPKFDASRIPSNWSEDLLLPRQWDARGHARGKLAPGGWIAKTDRNGETWEMFSVGYRNPYDMAFNADGELFAYDADMEWDLGSPWYRPTRVSHAISGSEFGWRSGTGKWPTYFPDSLPPVVEIGPGSPVGVEFGYGTKFPAKYQKALYLLDWTFGTIYAIHLTPNGSTYDGERTEFLSRTPLPLTDAAVGPDGALYFTIGGRGTQSELYRVTYVGDESTEPVEAKNQSNENMRETRQRLEALHHPGKVSKEDLDFIWSNLDSSDRFIRYAARVALEHRSVEQWLPKLDQADTPEQVVSAVIALARQGDPSQKAIAVTALTKLNPGEFEKEQKLAYLRAWALVFIRMGEPTQQVASELANKLDPYFPSDDSDVNRELARLLVYLNSPTVITKTLKLMDKPFKPTAEQRADLLARNSRYGGTVAQMIANQPDPDKVFYALVLRNLKYGWTLEQRQAYFEHLSKLREKSGGASYQGFIDNIRKEALENTTDAERDALERTVDLEPPSLEELPKPQGPGKNWTVDELVQMTKSGLTGRDFDQGRAMFAAAQCVRCHRYGGEGGATGPDLSNVAGRFGGKDLAEAIIDPSKVISDQYREMKVFLSSGLSYSGRVLSEADGKVVILTDPVDISKTVTVDKDDIEIMTPSKTSTMPAKLLNDLNREEVLDLMAYLLSRGNPNNPMFKK